MIIQVNSDHNISTTEGLVDHVNEVVHHAFDKWNTQITRVDVHLTDENGSKESENDKRCLIEVRMAGRPPLVVTDHASSVHEVIAGATEKMKHALVSLTGKQNHHRPI